ncbi:ume6p [Saccharomyces arboricola H-6]|uniref:Ume6p n=1 Tax=Saccharomyces arboricola (strain H-6 / AS 2.3317 / CBS 10644) TaxID=1160507 RepID=J8PYC6_SACAR|nr:ume6p [Saccharomyces arboricola H-6]
MLDKAPPQSKRIDESNAAASLLSMETTANNHHYLHNKTPCPTVARNSQDTRACAEDEGRDKNSSRHPGISSASIESVKTTYDENPLLSIMKSTCAPNNTPVHTPSGSPGLQVQSGNDGKDDSGEKDASAAISSLQNRRGSDNAVHAAASPLAPSNTPSDPRSLCNGHPTQVRISQASDAIQPQHTAMNDVVFPFSSASTNVNSTTTTIVAGAKEKINLPPPQAPPISSPGTTAAAGSGSGSGVRSRTGSDLPLIITSANKDNGKKTNSPLYILGRKNSSNNESNSFHSSDSRDSSANNETNGILRGETESAGGNRSSDSKTSHGGDHDHDDQYTTGVAPRNFYFNKDREITDPNVKLDDNESKVNISFWLNSKYRDEAYSLNESSSNNISSNTDTPTNSRHVNTSSSVPSRNNFQHFRFNQIPSQPPTSASSLTSTTATTTTNNNNNMSRTIITREEDPFATSSRPSTGFPYGDLRNRNNKNSPFNTNEPYIPPPPPKYINSKLDGLRSRLLLGPNSASSSTKLDDDLGTAAAVLSNMRSSPYRSHEKRITNVSNHSSNNKNNTNSLAVPASRPHSSSFPSKGVLRPILLRIHNSEQQQPIFESHNSTAVFDEDQDQDQDLSPYHLNPNSKKTLDPTFESRARQVTWNKNGKRIDRRLSAPEQQQQLEEPQLKKSRRSVGNAGGANHTNSGYNSLGESSTSSAPSSPSLRAYSSSLAYGAEYINATSPNSTKSKAKKAKSKTKSKAKQSSKKRSNNNAPKSKANDSQEMNTSSTAQGTRSRTGCWICRLRKKKCTEERPHCFNCERLKLDCHYDAFKPDFVSDPKKKQMKLEEIKKKTKEAKRRAMKKK